MLTYLRRVSGRSERKVRLFCCSVVRRFAGLLTHPTTQQAVEFAERLAEGLTKEADRVEMYRAVEEVWACLDDAYASNPLDPRNEFDALVLAAGVHRAAIAAVAGAAASSVGDMTGHDSECATCYWASEAAGWSKVPDGEEYNDQNAEASERTAQAVLLRHIIGNPFRYYPAPTSWPSNVFQLAEALYRGQDCRLPLSDALEEAGHAELAEHLRKEEWHPKGCWVVDLVAGKK